MAYVPGTFFVHLIADSYLQEDFELTPDAQIWPRSLNSDIGGSSSKYYLVVADIGTNSGEGMDFINGYAFLERLGDNLTDQQPYSYDALIGSTPCSIPRTSRSDLPRRSSPTRQPTQLREHSVSLILTRFHTLLQHYPSLLYAWLTCTERIVIVHSFGTFGYTIFVANIRILC